MLNRHRIRIFQASHGFLIAVVLQDKPKEKAALKPLRTRASYTIGERLTRWDRMALFNQNGRYRAMLLARPFQKLFDELVFSIAEEGRYLGLGLVKINQTTELIPWLLLIPN